MLESYKYFYQRLDEEGKYRELLAPLSECIDFSTNDYLGLSHSKLLLDAAVSAGEQFGVGATGSRLLSGNKTLFNEFETQIAIDKNCKTSLILNSGFQANISVLSSLLDSKVLGHKPLVFFDKLNHASLYQGVFLSGAELIRYSHNDISQLTGLLEKFVDDARSKFIVTETLFGMDGDIAPLEQIVNLARQHRAFLYLDEAHATGIIGKNGYGLSTTLSLQHMPFLIMGTFSKALGSFGAYIACSEEIKNYLINKCSGFIFGTALSPMIIGSAAKAWELVRAFEQQRLELWQKSKWLRSEVQQLGFNILQSQSHIIPIMLKGEKEVMNAKQRLLKEGILVSAIRPPSVPPGTSRLRIALTVNHSNEQLKQLITALKNL